MLFVGAIHAVDHPNHDGLIWFIDEVLPLIERVLRWETRLTIAGYIAPGLTLDRFKRHPRVTVRGPVADLTPLYDANRVFVAPARFAAGLPYKVHEAAAFGIPVVATTLLVRQLGWLDGEAIGAAECTDPAGFAARVIDLHRDAPLWTNMRAAALARVTVELDPDLFASRVEALLRPSEPRTTVRLNSDADLSARSAD
jgi:glycosyltransferase involved in cell wall biosynthesis